MLPADGTIAARVAHWEFGISRRQLKLTYILQGASKRPDNGRKRVTDEDEMPDRVSTPDLSFVLAFRQLRCCRG